MVGGGDVVLLIDDALATEGEELTSTVVLEERLEVVAMRTPSQLAPGSLGIASTSMEEPQILSPTRARELSRKVA